MTKTSLAAIIAAALLTILSASASAASLTFCVPSPGPGCANHNPLTVQAGLSHAMHATANATVRIAAGIYVCPTGGFNVTTPNQNQIKVVGAGTEQTTLTCPSTFDATVPETGVIRADGRVTISGLLIHIPSGVGDFGDGHNGAWLTDGALLSGVSIDADHSASSPQGAELVGSRIRSSTISMPSDLTDTAVSAFSGSTIDRTTASAGGDVIFGEHLTIRRSIITGPWDVLTQSGPIKVYDSLLDIMPGGPISGLHGLFAQQFNNAPSTPTITARNLTIVGGGSGAVGAAAVADYTGQVARVNLADSVISGPSIPLARQATVGQANITATYDDYPVGSYAGSGPGMTSESHIRHGNPGFVNPAMGVFDLSPGSALINAGTPGALVAGEPRTDQTGTPRLLAGRGTCVARRDIGAYEYAPAALPARATTPSMAAGVGQRVRLNGFGCSINPRLRVRFSWSFGDGSTASGQRVRHRYAHPGIKHVVLTVSDAAGRHGHAGLTINVT